MCFFCECQQTKKNVRIWNFKPQSDKLIIILEFKNSVFGEFLQMMRISPGQTIKKEKKRLDVLIVLFAAAMMKLYNKRFCFQTSEHNYAMLIKFSFFSR